MEQKTVVIGGFYVGMKMKDAYALLKSMCPKLKITIAEEAITIEGENMHFCDAVNGGVVGRFNFSEKLQQTVIPEYANKTLGVLSAKFALSFEHVLIQDEIKRNAGLLGGGMLVADLIVKQNAQVARKDDLIVTYYGSKSSVDLTPDRTYHYGDDDPVRAGMILAGRDFVKNFPNQGWENQKGGAVNSLRVESATFAKKFEESHSL